MRTSTITILAASWLVSAGAALAQQGAPQPPATAAAPQQAEAAAAPQQPGAAEAPQQPPAGGEPGFFRPAADPRLTTLAPPQPVTPAGAAPAPDAPPPMALTPDMAEQVRLAEEARLARIEAAMDRIEARNEQAVEEANRRLPVIASPMDGTAPILSPLDGTAPLVSGLGR